MNDTEQLKKHATDVTREISKAQNAAKIEELLDYEIGHHTLVQYNMSCEEARQDMHSVLKDCLERALAANTKILSLLHGGHE